MGKDKLYLIDGSSYIFRAYYAIRPLTNSKGMPTNALYGFTRMVMKFIANEDIKHVGIVFDTKEPTFRDEMYDEYKANRKEPPDDLVPQFPYFKKIVEALNIHNFTKPGFEADDIIGTIARAAEERGYEVVMITGDKDFMQLVTDNIKIYDTMKERKIDYPEVKTKFGVRPEQVTDIMGLVGDSSDNIPGVRGVGPKTALKLISQYGSLENLLENVDKVANPRIRVKLKEESENAKLSKVLATIKTDVPLDFQWDEFELTGPNHEKMEKLFTELEFFKLLGEVSQDAPKPSKKKSRSSKPHAVNIVQNEKELKNLVLKVKKSKETSLFFALKPALENEFLGCSVSVENESFYIPLWHETLESVSNFSLSDIRPLLLELEKKPLYLFDAKKILRKHSTLFDQKENVLDIKLAAYILNPAYPQDLFALSKQILGEESEIIADSDTPKRKKKEITPLTIDQAKDVACTGSAEVLKIANEICPELNKNFSRLLYKVEMPLMWLLLDMELKGIKVDVDHLHKLSKEYDKKIRALEEKIYDEAGEEFTINSPKQLSHIMFEVLDLPVIKKTKTGFSTDSSVLTELSEEYVFPEMILEYRSLTKLKSTYIDVLPTLADAKNNRIHTTFNQAVTATGRLSSSDPNLQNVPARTEEGKRIRKSFIADKDNVLLSADYSQIELRILADISGEKDLINAFNNGVDAHTATAANIFGVDESEVDSDMRGVAKTVNFGVLYGQSAFGLSKQLGINVGEADAYIKSYFEKYPKVASLREKILADASKNEYVETIFGRRRYIPDINSSNKSVKAFAERTAFNAVFQGTAADIIKMAMIDLNKTLIKDFPDTSILLQVHDELVFETPKSVDDKLIELIKEKMCEIVKLKVPLEVDVNWGKNWSECK